MELLGNLLKLPFIEDVASGMPKASQLCSRCVERFRIEDRGGGGDKWGTVVGEQNEDEKGSSAEFRSRHLPPLRHGVCPRCTMDLSQSPGSQSLGCHSRPLPSLPTSTSPDRLADFVISLAVRNELFDAPRVGVLSGGANFCRPTH
jgi:hypothetical protein